MDAALAEAAQMRSEPINLPAARLLKGALYASAKRYDEAVAAYREELKEEPFNALVDATAATLNAAGRTDEAVAVLRDWVAKAPDPSVSDALAAIDIIGHRYDQAAQNLQAVIAERPDDATALNNLAWIYYQQHNPKAHALAQRAYLLQPTAQAADTLGWILVHEGNTQVGMMLERRAALAMPGDPSVLYHLAVALQANGQHDSAAKLVAALLSKPTAFEERDDAVKLQAELGGPPAPVAAAPATGAPPGK
jgi:tetratricopeptide (TPR) repeat protein